MHRNRRNIAILCALLGSSLGSACRPAESGDPHIAQIQSLEDKSREQARQIAAKDAELENQQKVIQELRGLEGPRRLENLVRVGSIQIERLSGGYDDDGDGTHEGFVVYLRMQDQDGDVIKAAGSARVQLFDLSPEGAGQIVGQAQLEPDALRQSWYGKLMTSHYTIKVPWTDGKHPGNKSITAVVNFTELLTGRTFEAQHAAAVLGQARE